MPAQSDTSRLTLVEYGLIAAIAVIWGANNAAAKVATQVLPPMLTACLRFAIAAALLAPFALGPLPRTRKLGLLMLLAGPVHFSLIYFGFSIAHDLSPISVSLQLWIPMTALASWIFLKEPLSRAAITGMLAAFGGIIVMVLDPHALRDWPSILVGALASAAWALATITARQLPAVSALKIQGLTSFCAALTFAVASAAFERGRWGQLAHADGLIWGAVVFSAVGSTVMATAALFWLVQRREAGRVTPYMLTSPVVSMSIGVLFLGDIITPQILAGALLCMGGVAIVAVAERRRVVAPEQAASEAAVEGAGSTA